MPAIILLQAIENLRKERDLSAAQSADLAEALAESQARCEEAEGQLMRPSGLPETNEDSLLELQAALDEANDRVAALEAELEAQQGVASGLAEDLEDLQAALQEAHDEKEALRARLEAAQRELGEARAQIDSMSRHQAQQSAESAALSETGRVYAVSEDSQSLMKADTEAK
eukprot:scaffold678179_cov41-Prasinocladus_malaysianus.AAC.1